MTLDISKEVKEFVIKDREGGMSLNAIVDKWKAYGVTKNWVRRNTVNPMLEDESKVVLAIEQILPLAVRDIGVTYSEYSPILADVFGMIPVENTLVINVSNSQKSYIRAKVKDRASKAGMEARFISEIGDCVVNEDDLRVNMKAKNSTKLSDDNTNYVYIVRVEGNPCYVGKGKGDRYKHVTSGSSSCAELNKALFTGKHIDVEFFATGLSNEDSKLVEAEQIDLLIKDRGRDSIHNAIIPDLAALRARKTMRESSTKS